MPIDYKVIGSKIKSARGKRDLTQSQLAELLSVSPEYVSRVERSSTHLSLNTLVEIAKHLNVSPGYILEGAMTGDVNYALGEFADILDGLNSDKKKLLLEIAKVIAK